jgi:hypothetical protein
MWKKVPSFYASGSSCSADWIQETFLVFSEDIPSGNLGFIDRTASSLDVTIGSREFTITQSPGLLRSNTDGGTTGAVLWKVTPLVAAWLNEDNFLWQNSILTDKATIVELGCGISGLIGLSVAPLVNQYILTDQSYVMKQLRQNIVGNQSFSSTRMPRKGKSPANISPKAVPESLTLDWETDSAINVRNALGDRHGVTLLLACDCIYNDFLVKPFVQMCLEICALHSQAQSQAPTVVLVAQQLRSDEIFLEWLRAMTTHFHVWRVPDHCLSRELRSGSGLIVHLALKKGEPKS